MECTPSFVSLLVEFRCVFTRPSFQIFLCVATGWVLSHRRRFVTELIWSSGCTRCGHHSRYPNFFSKSVWGLDVLGEVLAKLVVRVLVPTGPIELAVDDTLCRKRGLTLYGTGMHHDPLISSRAKPLVNWGHDWVVVTLIVRCPFWAPSKVWSLPIAFRLYRNRQGVTKRKRKKKGPKRKTKQRNKQDANHRTRPELAVELISLVASWFPQRKLVVTGDSAYGGQSVLGKLPANVALISHVRPKGALYEPAPAPLPNQTGRPPKKGRRLPGMAAWADDPQQPWKELGFDQFGLHATLLVKTLRALYYKAGKDRLLTIVLVRDALGQRADQMFYGTCLDWDAREILAKYAACWPIEVLFKMSKQYLGLGDYQMRRYRAVERYLHLVLIAHLLLTHLAADEPGAQADRRNEPHCLRLSSVPKMQQTLRAKLWDDVITSMEKGSRNRRVGKKIREVIQLWVVTQDVGKAFGRFWRLRPFVSRISRSSAQVARWNSPTCTG